MKHKLSFNLFYKFFKKNNLYLDKSIDKNNLAKSVCLPNEVNEKYLITPELLFGLPTTNLIEYLYRIVLRRDADKAGYYHYQDLVDQGMPIILLFYELRFSSEGRKLGMPYRNLKIGLVIYFLHCIFNYVGLSPFIWKIACWYEERLRIKVVKHLNSDNFLVVDENVSGKEIVQVRVMLKQLMDEVQIMSKNYILLKSGYELLQSKQGYLDRRNQLKELPLINENNSVKDSLKADIEAYYVSFEDAHRGSTESIQKGFDDYDHVLPELALLSGEILDLGCGRGEWLSWLAKHGKHGKGVDSNPVMVEICREKGQRVEYADLMKHLKSLPNKSHTLITAFHVAEHLPFETLFEMIQQIHRILVPRGMMILETPNPENISVGAHTFYHDFSHRAPITPVSLEFLAKYHGFIETRILRRNPHPLEDHLEGIDPVAVKINHFLSGPQDFALIAKAPFS